MNLAERQKAMVELAAQVNAGRQPQFADHMRNPWAGEGNPSKDGYFVQAKRVTGKFNAGLWYRMTDRKGKFWEINGQTAMFIEHLTGSEVMP